MLEMQECRNSFENIPKARYAADIIFQHSFRRTGNIQKIKKYSSENHDLHGLTSEVSIFPSGMPTGCRNIYPGAGSEFKIFNSITSGHKNLTKNLAQKIENLDDAVDISDQYLMSWADLCTDAYIGVRKLVLTIFTKLKPINGFINLAALGKQSNITW